MTFRDIVMENQTSLAGCIHVSHVAMRGHYLGNSPKTTQLDTVARGTGRDKTGWSQIKTRKAEKRGRKDFADALKCSFAVSIQTNGAHPKQNLPVLY